VTCAESTPLRACLYMLSRGARTGRGSRFWRPAEKLTLNPNRGLTNSIVTIILPLPSAGCASNSVLVVGYSAKTGREEL